jgi:hypothetical protein
MKIGDLIEVIPGKNILQYSYLRPLLSKIGIIVDIQVFSTGPANYITLIEEKLHTIPEYNAKLIASTKT